MNRVFRVGRRVALVAGVIAAVVLGLALPASAHSTTITGNTVCFNGNHIVTWHIENSSQTTNLPMTIVSVEAHVGATAYAVTGYTSPLAKGASTDATSTVPGGVSGTITATVHARWPDGITDDDTASVTLLDNCVPPTTTTVPETTTTDVGGTTTIATTTSTQPPTTTPITGEGSTVPTVVNQATTTSGIVPSELPRTGSTSGYVVFFGLSCIAAGVLLALRRHRSWVQ